MPQRNLRGGLAWRHRPISGFGGKWIAARGPSGVDEIDATLADLGVGERFGVLRSREPAKEPVGERFGAIRSREEAVRHAGE